VFSEDKWGAGTLGIESFSYLGGNECLEKETRYKQSADCVGNRKGSPTVRQNFVNFGPQTA